MLRFDLTGCRRPLERAREGALKDWRSVQSCIEDLMVACASDFISDAKAALNAGKASSPPRRLASDFKLIANNRCPLSSVRCIGVAETYLGQALRTRQSDWLESKGIGPERPIKSLRARRLNTRDHELIRAEAVRLSDYFRKMATNNKSTKISQQTAIRGLADIFCRATDFAHSPYSLPHAVESHFIQFCVAAMRPFCLPSEASEEALSSAWKRMKKAEAASA